MRLLLVNPNTSRGMTDRLAGVAQAAAGPGTTIHAVTATTGPEYIATRAEAVLGAVATLELMAVHAGNADAAIVAAFGDPGLGAARELLAIPVVGMAEAAMLTACMLGRRFAIVTFAQALEPWYQECVDYNGLSGRSAGVFCLDEPFRAVADVAAEKADQLVALCGRAVAAGAECCILGGAPLAGLAARISGRVSVPLVDAAVAAVKQAEALVALRPGKATAGSFRQPGPKQLTGLSPGLQALFTG